MKIKIMGAIVTILFGVAACGGPDIEKYESLLVKQPRVMSVTPMPGASAVPDVAVTVDFSEPVAAETVDGTTLAITKASENAAPNEIAASVSNGDVLGAQGSYEFSADGRSVTFRSDELFESGAIYWLVLTNKILSVERVPLEVWSAGEAGAYLSWFYVADDNTNRVGTPADAVTSGSVGDVSNGDANQGQLLSRPSFLLINEVLYDVPGSDVDGQVFVELYGDAEADVGGYKINFISGDDGAISDTIEIPSGVKTGSEGIFVIADARTGSSDLSQVADADLIVNFDPQNGPDCVQLLDDRGNLLDALGYGSPIVAAAENGLVCVEGTPASKVAAGHSVSRELGKNSGNNINDFKEATVPTPGVL